MFVSIEELDRKLMSSYYCCCRSCHSIASCIFTVQFLAIVTAALKLWLVLQHCCYCTSVAVNRDEQTRFNVLNYVSSDEFDRKLKSSYYCWCRHCHCCFYCYCCLYFTVQLLAIVTAALKLWLVLQHCCYCISVAVNHDEQTRFNKSTNVILQ
jgi:hypothetical protein